MVFEKDRQPTLITAAGSPASLAFAGLTIRVLGPQKAKIEALQAAFDAFIAAKHLSVEAMLAAYADKSVPNLSSIVCLVEQDGKRILLTGDARGDKIRAGLEQRACSSTGSWPSTCSRSRTTAAIATWRRIFST